MIVDGPDKASPPPRYTPRDVLLTAQVDDMRSDIRTLAAVRGELLRLQHAEPYQLVETMDGELVGVPNVTLRVPTEQVEAEYRIREQELRKSIRDCLESVRCFVEK